MNRRNTLLTLATLWADHDRVTHWAISMRLVRKGDFFKRLMDGHDCREATYRRVLRLFSDHWPADLSWPADIPRPEPSEHLQHDSGEAA